MKFVNCLLSSAAVSVALTASSMAFAYQPLAVAISTSNNGSWSMRKFPDINQARYVALEECQRAGSLCVIPVQLGTDARACATIVRNGSTGALSASWAYYSEQNSANAAFSQCGSYCSLVFTACND